MIQAEQTPINWTEIGVFVGAISVTVAVIGWFVAHKLTASREKEQRRERCLRAISDFEITINKWQKSINGVHVPRNHVWGVTLGGGIDFYADAIHEVRARSIESIESPLYAIRPFMNAAGKARIDNSWHSYQEYNIEGQAEIDPKTGQEFTSHIKCKTELIECLEQLKIAAQEAEV